MKQQIWNAALHFIQKNSDRGWANRVQAVAYALYRASYNPGYHLERNGELRALNLAAQHMDGPLIVVDAGANIGKWSKCASEVFGDRATIHAFEPSPPTYDILLRNVAGIPQIRPHCLGLSDERKTVTILHSPSTSEKTSVERPAAEALNTKLTDYQKLPAQLIRGDEFCRENGIDRIDFLKIDTEGHDLNVLRGFGGMLASGAISLIQFEYNRLNLFTGNLLRCFYAILNPPGAAPRYRIGRLFPNSIRFKDYGPEDENFIDGNFVAVLETRPQIIRALA